MQSHIPVQGHAVECRLYAEDPENNFFPCTGRILTWDPAKVTGVRYDGGIRSGKAPSSCCGAIPELISVSQGPR